MEMDILKHINWKRVAKAVAAKGIQCLLSITNKNIREMACDERLTRWSLSQMHRACLWGPAVHRHEVKDTILN